MDMLNAVKNVLADVSSVSPLPELVRGEMQLGNCLLLGICTIRGLAFCLVLQNVSPTYLLSFRIQFAIKAFFGSKGTRINSYVSESSAFSFETWNRWTFLASFLQRFFALSTRNINFLFNLGQGLLLILRKKIKLLNENDVSHIPNGKLDANIQHSFTFLFLFLHGHFLKRENTFTTKR